LLDAAGVELLALERSMPILEAEDELKGPVADSRLYDVVLAATGDEEVAWDAQMQRVADRLRKNETPDV
jgi:hypothetical protein